MQWEYQKILLNEHHRREDDLDLYAMRERELVTITPNNVAYLKREVLRSRGREEFDRQQNHAAAMKAKYRNPATGETWSGPGRMATRLKIEKYRG